MVTQSGQKSPSLGIVAALVLFASSGFAWAQVPGQAIEDFKASLDPQVFEAGGYGAWSTQLNPIFDNAAATYNVPRELLVALGYLGSGFENRGSQPTIEDGYGVMALRQNKWGGDSLTVAAGLINSTPEAVKSDPDQNIMGAAAVLNAWAQEAAIDRKGGLDAWLPVLLRYAGLADNDLDKMFAGEVYTKLKDGINVTNSYGETFGFEPQTIKLDPASLMSGNVMTTVDYGGAIWDPAASCNYSTAVNSKDTIIIHTIEGTAAGARSWFKNCNAQVSAHYVVSEGGGVWQCVLEQYSAWHVGCLNARSIGIEHEGYASSSSHPASLYNASALLCRNICDRRGIAKAHHTCPPGILGHGDANNCVCGGTHWDPGSGWDWNYFIGQINGTPPPPTWAATYTAHSYSSSMQAGSTAIVWAEFRNDGTGHWKHAETRLGTQDPQDRSSPFCTSGNWVSCNRPTDVDQSDVAQGQTGRFTFVMTAPSTPGTYTEKYRLVREGVTWFGPTITWTITVTASTGNLNGTVTNASSGAAIAGATVTLTGVGSKTTNSSGAYSWTGLTAGTYNISVSATGYSGQSSSVTINAGSTATKNFALTPSDTQAPTTPTLQTASATGPTSVQLSWSASTDNIGVTGYQISRNGSVVGTSTSISYTDTGLTGLTTYTYEVRAKDAVPNYSAWSNSLQVTTPEVPPTPQIVFSDGFNGSISTSKWTQGGSAFAYSTGQTHGTYTGAGAAFCAANEADQMWHQFSRPFAGGKVGAWFYDGKGGWKAGVCGWSYRQCLSLRDLDGAAKMYIDNYFYSALDNTKYFYRTIGSGGVSHTAYATRNANTSCDGAWIYFETTVNPGAPGALGTVQVKVTDGSGTFTASPAMTSDFYSWGIGRVNLGLGYSSTGECYWDDVAFQATAPGVPSMSAPTVLSATQIRWNFARADNNIFGFDVADEANAIVAPQYPNTGWLGRTSTSWTESGLSPNTQYTRQVRSWNGTLNSAAFSNAVSATTPAPAPTANSVTASSTTVCANDTVTWTAVGGFGPGKVQYYTYDWDQNASHTFDGSEAVWSAGTIDTQATAAGTWYLHVKAFNSENVASGTFDYALTAAPATQITTAPVNVAACLGGEATLSLGAVGGNLTYQWQKDGVDIPGATAAQLLLGSVSEADVAVYKCIVSGTCGTVTSREVDLSISDAPLTIDEQPVSSRVCQGAPASFSVSATNAVSYQWQKDGSDIAGATGAEFSIASASTAAAGTYQCIVTGQCESVTSDPATLIVNTPIALDFDGDCDVDSADVDHFVNCALGPGIPQTDPACANTLLDEDQDVDQSDFAKLQRCLSGEGSFADPSCLQ